MAVDPTVQTALTAAQTALTNLASAIDASTYVPPGVTPPTPVVPGAPKSVSASAGDGTATVTWSAGTPGTNPTTGYTVTASPGGIHTSTTGTTVTVTGLTDGTTYTFTVTATSSDGTSSPSAPSAGVTPTAPAPPPTTGARLFADSSLWNTVKTNPTFVAAADSVLHGATYGLNNGAFAHPTYFAKSTDPVTTFRLGAGWGHPATTITSPAPSGMTPTSGSDHVMSVLLSNGTLLDLDSCSGSGTSFTATYYGTSDGVNGPGFGGTANAGANGNAYYAIGTTAIGSTQAGGTILARDVAAGVIPHGLCMAWDYSALGGKGTSGSPSVSPAVSNDCGGGPGPLPEGGLLLIPASTAMPSGLSAMGKALWTAAATYGVYITDQLSGNPQFYGDGSSTVGNAFNANDFTTVGRALRLVQTW